MKAKPHWSALSRRVSCQQQVPDASGGVQEANASMFFASVLQPLALAWPWKKLSAKPAIASFRELIQHLHSLAAVRNQAARKRAMEQQRSIVEALVGACDELSLLLRTLEITRTQNFISVKSVSTPSEAQAAPRVAAHKRAGLLAAGRSLRRSLELNKELLAAEDEKRRTQAQERREKEDALPQLSQQAHVHLLYQALKQDERILLTCTDGDFSMLLDGEHTLHFSVAPPSSDSGGEGPRRRPSPSRPSSRPRGAS